MIRYITLLSFLFLLNAGYAQNILVHTDKPYYVTGEMIWFKVYLPAKSADNVISVKSVITDASGIVQDYFFLSNEKKSFVQGYYKIPFDIKSGIYPIHFIVKDSLNQKRLTLATLEIPIYNDLENVSTTSQIDLSESNVSEQYSQLKITTDLGENLKRREKTILRLKITDTSGKPVNANLSISIFDQLLLHDSLQTIHSFDQPANIKTAGSDFFYSFKMDTTVKGDHKNIVGIFSPIDWKTNYTSPASDKLFIHIPPFLFSKTYQLVANPERQLRIFFESNLNYPIKNKLNYTDDILKYLELSRIRKKIYQLYSALETNISIPEGPTPKTKPLVEPDRVIHISKYENMENLYTLFRELSTPLSFRLDKKTNTYTANMYDPVTLKDFPEPPLFILDNRIVNNLDGLAKMKMSQVESIEMYYDFKKIFYYLKLLGRNGIVHIKTKSKVADRDLAAFNVFELKGLQSTLKFPELNPNDLKSPVLRTLLYWNASITTDENGQVDIPFTVGDDLSRFKINITAQSKDGLLGTHSREFEVRNY